LHLLEEQMTGELGAVAADDKEQVDALYMRG